MTVQPIGKANKLVSSERMYVSTERIGNFKSDNRTNLVVKRTCMYILSSQMNELKSQMNVNMRQMNVSMRQMNVNMRQTNVHVFLAKLIEVIRTNFGSNERK